MTQTKGKLIAMLNSVYDDGGFAEIIAIAVVKDDVEGELWFCENKPDDGTHVDYTLHKISEVFAASDLLAACKAAINAAACYNDTLHQQLQKAIAKAEGG